MSYSSRSGYLPEPIKITPTQAHILASRFASQSRAVAKFAKSRRVSTVVEQFQLALAVSRLINEVPRGPGHCLNRAALVNLRNHIIDLTPTCNAKQKDYANV